MIPSDSQTKFVNEFNIPKMFRMSFKYYLPADNPHIFLRPIDYVMRPLEGDLFATHFSIELESFDFYP